MLPYFFVGLVGVGLGWTATTLAMKRPFLRAPVITESEFALAVFVLLTVISLIARW